MYYRRKRAEFLFGNNLLLMQPGRLKKQIFCFPETSLSQESKLCLQVRMKFRKIKIYLKSGRFLALQA